MSHQHDEEEVSEEVSIEEMVMSQVYAIQALLNVLERKGIITHEEIIEEIQAIQEADGGCDCDCGCHCGEDHCEK